MALYRHESPEVGDYIGADVQKEMLERSGWRMVENDAGETVGTSEENGAEGNVTDDAPPPPTLPATGKATPKTKD